MIIYYRNYSYYREIAVENNTVSRIIIDQGFKPINPFQCGKERCAPSHAFGPAARDCWLLHFVVSGKGQFVTSRGRYTVCAGQVFIIKPHQITYYEADEEEPWHYYWLGFTSEIPLPSLLTANDVITAPYLRITFITACDSNLFDEGETSGAYEYFVCGMIWQMLGLIKRRPEAASKAGQGYVTKAVSIIRSEYQSELTVEGIAKRLHLNRSYFCETFKSYTGVSPKEYLKSVRMQRAVELLSEMNMSVSVTATSVGYPDVFAFSRAFKKYYNCSPSEYAKNVSK